MEDDTIIIKAKSSSNGLYNVSFTNSDNNIIVFCDCKAGMYGFGGSAESWLIQQAKYDLWQVKNKGKEFKVKSFIRHPSV